MTAGEKVRAARTALVARFPYLYPVVYLLSLVETEEVPTMAVDNRGRLYYNPRFVEAVEPYLVGLLWHEVHHVLRGHTGPRGEPFRAHPLGAVALDLEVNDDAEEAGVSLPRTPHPYGGWFPEDLGFPRGLLAEEYLELLKGRALELRVGMDAHGPGPWEEEGEGLSEAALEVARRAVAQKAKEYEAAGRGTLPAGMRRWVREVLEARADWRSELRRLLKGSLAQAMGRRRPTYTRPNRRASAFHPVLVPGSYGLKPKVAVVVDTSGSMGQEDLAQALGEVKAILKQVRAVSLISTDAAAYGARRIARWEEVELRGGGGTDMREGIRAAEEAGADVVVVLTDGYTPWPERPPKVITLALILDEQAPEPPFFIRRVVKRP